MNNEITSATDNDDEHVAHVFSICKEINDLINTDKEDEARNSLILLLDYHKKHKILYTPLVNHLIRCTGLYPYIHAETADWNERLIYDLFKVDVGLNTPITLHREQSLILKRLLNGESLAVSAPTSFGKSFIIDAFISLNKPTNVLIIVPTISLTDETRRRLHKKYAAEYKIITTAEVSISQKNIFIFPQERAISYLDKINELDLLIIDEFYKASENHDKERAPALLKAIMKFTKIAKQRYFLAPNISTLKSNPFTKGMEFLKLDFSTVFLEKHDLSKQINEDPQKKSSFLLDILENTAGKSLIYAGTYSNINKISAAILNNHKKSEVTLLKEFSDWLRLNYSQKWMLADIIEKGTGIHNGQLHRSISQIQIKLFEENNGLKNLISTSSIVEGVNTAAENVIIWQSKNGNRNLKDFMYKNIIGRSGRMFKHFVGKIYLLSPPPKEEDNELDLTIPNALVGDIDETEFKNDLTPEQISAIIAYKEEMQSLLGFDTFNRLQSEGAFKSNDPFLIRDIAVDISMNPSDWLSISYLNSENPESWDYFLYKIIKLKPAGWGVEYNKFVSYVKIASYNWKLTIPEILRKLSKHNITINELFELERNLTFKLSSLLNDVNVLLNELIPNRNTDISPFIYKTSNAFLPPIVYQLEEYGLPRMITKKIDDALNLDLDNEELTLHTILDHLKTLNYVFGLSGLIGASMIEEYIMNNFFDGVTYSQ